MAPRLTFPAAMLTITLSRRAVCFALFSRPTLRASLPSVPSFPPRSYARSVPPVPVPPVRSSSSRPCYCSVDLARVDLPERSE
jgi:hypothetical protein